MRRLWRAWNRFWFAPETALNLAAARVIFAGHALWVLLSRDLAGMSALPPEFWAGLAPGTRWRYLLFPGHPEFEMVLQWTARATLLLALLGVHSRVCCLFSALLLYHLAPLESAIWMPAPYERGFTISVLALTVLACGRSDDALSLRRAGAAGPSWEYGWPLKLVQLFLCNVYLASGVAKLVRAGLGWISAENLRGWLLVMNQLDQIVVFDRLGPWIAERPLLCLTLAAATVALDMGFVAVLFWRRARLVLVPAALAFHTGILLAMNIAFLNVPQLLVFVDWSGLGRRLRPAADQEGRTTAVLEVRTAASSSDAVPSTSPMQTA